MRTLHTLAAPSLVAVALAACGGEPPQPPAAPTAPAAPTTESATTKSDGEKKPDGEKAAEAPKAKGPAVRFTGAFATPESVLYDADGDRYLVSNIQGKPTDVDNNGFISELSPDGKITNAKWIAGGANKVTLNAPKGMALVAGVLYVADLDHVRMFDAKSGAPKGAVKIAGATFLNDVAAGKDGTIFVTDTGVKLGANGFEPTGTDAVWTIAKGKAKALSKSKELGGPNGVLATDKGVTVVTFVSGELFHLDAAGKKSDATKLPKGGLDGILALGDELLVSSWEASAVFRGKAGGTFEAVISDVKAPADIGFDTKRSRVLVPRFMEDAVEAYDLK